MLGITPHCWVLGPPTTAAGHRPFTTLREPCLVSLAPRTKGPQSRRVRRIPLHTGDETGAPLGRIGMELRYAKIYFWKRRIFGPVRDLCARRLSRCRRRCFSHAPGVIARRSAATTKQSSLSQRLMLCFYLARLRALDCFAPLAMTVLLSLPGNAMALLARFARWIAGSRLRPPVFALRASSLQVGLRRGKQARP
jgi:hypothetical protein